MFRNRKAQLFTLDLLLALVPLTLVLGYSASAMSGVITQIQEYSYFYSNQRTVNDAIDVIVKTPGEPPDWNSTYPSDGPNVLGLAEYDESTGNTEPNYLDDGKVGALNDTYKTCIPKLIGNVTYYNLSIEGKMGLTNISFFNSWANGSRDSASNIFVAERIAAFDIVKGIGSLDEIARVPVGDNACDPSAQPTYYMSFYVEDGDTDSYDYWIVGERDVDDNANADAWVYDEDYVDSQGGPDPCDWVSPPAEYSIYPIPGGTPACQCPAIDTCQETTIDFVIHKIKIDDDLDEGETNYVFIKLYGVPTSQTTYYLLRVPTNTCNNLVLPGLAVSQPVLVRLEVGR